MVESVPLAHFMSVYMRPCKITLDLLLENELMVNSLKTRLGCL